MTNRPTLLGSCAYAATAAEARYRIDAKPQQPRSTRVVALDPGAAKLVGGLAGRPWLGARFLTFDPTDHGGDERADLELIRDRGGPVRLSDELVDVDFMLMVATASDGAAAATAIGNACTLRGIMTAGVILDGGAGTDAAVSALRPYARVLLVTKDQRDVAELMAAVGA
jgi:hypothetical protein